MKHNKKVDFITKKHSQEFDFEIANDLTYLGKLDETDFLIYGDEFSSLESKFVGGYATEQTMDILGERL